MGYIDWERVAVWLLVLLLVATTGFLVYVATPYTAPPEQVREARATSGVTVTPLDGSGYVVTPTGDDTTRALVFYPGARVHPNAYLPVFAPLVAETGIAVFVPQPPLNLAVFDADMAAPILRRNPDVDQWYVGGHSLGGAMACRFAGSNADRVTGLVLLASYCDRNVSDTGLRVLAVRGSADTVLDGQTYRRNLDNFPPTRTRTVVIDGMNHTQVGAYSGQPGDSPAAISYERAHERLRAVLAAFLTGGDASTVTTGRVDREPPASRGSGFRKSKKHVTR